MEVEVERRGKERKGKETETSVHSEGWWVGRFDLCSFSSVLSHSFSMLMMLMLMLLECWEGKA